MSGTETDLRKVKKLLALWERERGTPEGQVALVKSGEIMIRVLRDDPAALAAGKVSDEDAGACCCCAALLPLLCFVAYVFVAGLRAL